MKKNECRLNRSRIHGKGTLYRLRRNAHVFWPAPAIPVKKIIVDINAEVANDSAQKLSFESCSTDWHDLVRSPEIDVIDICTPNNAHAEIAIAAARAGKTYSLRKAPCLKLFPGKGNVFSRKSKQYYNYGRF